MDSMDFSGKVALITGSSSGIGEEIAISFARLGANVVITGRDETKIATVVETCTKASPKKSNAFGVKCDMNNDKEVRELADMVIETFGKIDILVNNAGIGTFVPITDVNVVDTYDLIMKTNLRAPFLLTHLLATHLIKSKGSIINISSVAALHALEQGSIYCMSKAALDMLTKCLAVELGPKGVRVNSVNPATIRTPMLETAGLTEDMIKGLKARCEAEYPLRRIGEVEDVAKVVTFLASQNATFLTGLTVQVDGGCLHTTSGRLPPPKH